MDSSDSPCILALNGGSSSIKFAIYHRNMRSAAKGAISRTGSARAVLEFQESGGGAHAATIAVPPGLPAPDFLLGWLESLPLFGSIRVVGHRVVHGMHHAAPALVTPDLMSELRRWSDFSPEHMPVEIGLMDQISRRHPALPQVACFDTSFHQGMPRVAKQIAVPRRFEHRGLQRYGFHGLSYSSLMEQLAALPHGAADGRILLAHLGNGASMAAVCDGRSLDTSMGFTPAAGLVMGTRSGDLDPGVVTFLARAGSMPAGRLEQLLNHESGMLGISQTSADVRDLLAVESSDIRAAEALALFCYQARKFIGAYCAVLEGLDTLVFTGGIGANAPAIRERICSGLGFLGIHVDPERNSVNAPLISADNASVKVRVMQTDEESVIARSCAALLDRGAAQDVRPASD